MSALLENLNHPQHDAVSTTDGPLLVLAGAGTGKTRVLTTRLAHILSEGLAFPNEILAVTFTNKAAKEMVERVEAMLGQSAAGAWLGTFHALGARMLRRHAEAAGLDPNFTILNPDDQKRILDDIADSIPGFDKERFPARLLMNIISNFKDNAWTPEDVPHDEAENADRQIVPIYRAYQERLTALNACDFGDLLLKPLVMFKNHADILEKYQQQFKYVLVDEYQDTNAVQYLWLRLLAMHHKNICVVGDDDQSIYAWRGAQVGNILQFEKHFPGAKVVRLEQNYRSTGKILKAASGLISKNSQRHSKTLWTEGDDGNAVEVHSLLDAREEARFIADTIERAVGRGIPYQNHAVLVRTSAQTRAIEERFMKHGVPYTLIGLLKFYERKEIRDALAYLRLVQTNVDDLAFLRIVNVPRRGVGDAALQEIQKLASSNNCPLFTAAKMAVEQGTIATRTLNQLRPFIDLIQHWRAQLADCTPDELMDKILEESGYFQMLRDDKNKEEARTRLDNLKELLRAMQEYADLSSFLEKAALATDGEEDDSATVKVMTVHGAKGLEFDTVFIPGFEEGLFPHIRSLNESGTQGVEEERRLAYVALTRARKQAILTHCTQRFMYGSFEGCTPSRFLQEIPQDAIKHCGSTPSLTSFGGGSFRPQPGSRFDKKWKGGNTAKPQEPLVVLKKTTDGAFDIGQRVFHQKFGYGRIKNAEGAGPNARYTINFEKAGQKKLVASLAKLEAA